MIRSPARQALDEDVRRLRSRDGYLNAGIPNYERLFGRDSAIAAWQVLKTNPEIARATLVKLAEFQGSKTAIRSEEQPGKILHEHYVGGWPEKFKDLFQTNQSRWLKFKILLAWKFPYYGSVDSTAWFLILLHAYYRQTNDRELLEKLWPHAERALAWAGDYGPVGGDVLIRYEKQYRFGLTHQGWKDNLGLSITAPVALVEVQGYYYLAYRLMAELAVKLGGRQALANDLVHRAAQLKTAVNQRFWLDHENYFCLAIDGQDRPVPVVTSNPGHLLFTEIVAKERVAPTVSRLFAADLWTPYGIRTHSTDDPSYDSADYHQGSVWPHDNWIIHQGLKRAGYQAEARQIEQALWRAYEELGDIPELYGVKDDRLVRLASASSPQAWSSGALLNFLADQSPS